MAEADSAVNMAAPTKHLGMNFSTISDVHNPLKNDCGFDIVKVEY
jgi:hypothetical protein